MVTPPSRPWPFLAALLLFSVRAAAGTPETPSAQTLDQLCGKYPDHCAELTALSRDDDTLEADVNKCSASPCEPDALFALDGRLVAAGENTTTTLGHADVRSDECEDLVDRSNYFYVRLASIHAELAQAWAPVALKDPSTVPPDSMAAIAAANQVCTQVKGGLTCPLARTIVLESAEFETALAACRLSGAACAWTERKSLLSNFLVLQGQALHLLCLDKSSNILPAEVRAVFANYSDPTRVTDLVSGVVQKNVGANRDTVAKLGADIDNLSNIVQIGDKGAASAAAISALEQRVGAMGGELNSKSLMIDQLTQAGRGQTDKSGKPLPQTLVNNLRDQVNQENQAYAALRAKLKALRIAAGFSSQDVGAVGEGPVESYPPAARPTPPQTPIGAPKPPAAKPLDGTTVPDAAPAPAPPAPILPGNPTDAQLMKNLLSSDPSVQDDAYRRAHLSYTVGDPGRRAALAYQQDSPDACGVVAEQEVLLAYGRIHGGTPEQQQQQLRDEAAQSGLFHAGTPADLSGALLEKHWLSTKVQNDASVDQLNSSVNTGNFVIAAVDARPLWNLLAHLHPDDHGYTDESKPLMHNILITGAEVSKVGRAVMGYYINDSGAYKYSSYFVPAQVFAQAFNGGPRTFVEVLH